MEHDLSEELLREVRGHRALVRHTPIHTYTHTHLHTRTHTHAHTHALCMPALPWLPSPLTTPPPHPTPSHTHSSPVTRQPTTA